MLFVTQVDSWRYMVPERRGESLGQAKRFFGAIRALMSINLRSMAIKSLEDFLDFMRQYSSGNHYEG